MKNKVVGKIPEKTCMANLTYVLLDYIICSRIITILQPNGAQ